MENSKIIESRESIFDTIITDKIKYSMEWHHPPKDFKFNNSKILCDGYLKEQPEKIGLCSQHYYILTNENLIRFKDQDESKIYKIIFLIMPKIGLIQIDKQMKYGIILSCLGSDIFLFAETKQLAFKWYEAFSKVGVLTNFESIYIELPLIIIDSTQKFQICTSTIDHNKYSLKVVNKVQLKRKSTFTQLLLNEIMILRKLKHKRIIKLKSVYENEDYVKIVFELIRSEDMFTILKRIVKYSEIETSAFIKDLLNTLEYIHSENVIHRNLKFENIQFEDENNLMSFKIVDFGKATFYHEEEPPLMRCGTIGYVAPEVLQKKPYGNKVDLYSVGIMTYVMLTGHILSTGSIEEEISFHKNHDMECLDEFCNNIISSNALSFIKLLIDPDPQKRPSALEACHHKWLNSYSDPERIESANALLSQHNNKYQNIFNMNNLKKSFQIKKHWTLTGLNLNHKHLKNIFNESKKNTDTNLQPFINIDLLNRNAYESDFKKQIINNNLKDNPKFSVSEILFPNYYKKESNNDLIENLEEKKVCLISNESKDVEEVEDEKKNTNENILNHFNSNLFIHYSSKSSYLFNKLQNKKLSESNLFSKINEDDFQIEELKSPSSFEMNKGPLKGKSVSRGKFHNKYLIKIKGRSKSDKHFN